MDRHANEIMFPEASAKISGKKPYLGDPRVLNALLRNATEAYSKAATAKAVEKIALEAAMVLLGRRPDHYADVRGWNRAGSIDAHAAKWLGSSETDPVQRMRHAMYMLFGEFSDLAKVAATPGVLPEQWQWTAGTIYDRYVAAFLGIDAATLADMEQAAGPVVEPWKP